MAKKLISRTEFARLAGVAPASVTKACKGQLLPATDGKRIDANHPAAQQYLARHDERHTPAVATGLDPLYERALAACESSNVWSGLHLRKTFRIGGERAGRILAQFAAAGVLPDQSAPPPPKPPHVRGTAARKQQRKGGMGGEAFVAPPPPPPVPAPTDDGRLLEVPEDIQAFADMTLRELVERFGTDVRFVDWLKATQTIEAINEKRLKNAQTKGELVSRQLMRVGVIEPIDAAHIKLLTDGAKTIARRATAMHDADRPMEDIEKFVADQISSFIKPIKSRVARALDNA